MCQNTDNSSFLTRKPRKNHRIFQELDRKTALQNCGKQRGKKYCKIQYFSRKKEDRWIMGGGDHIYIYIYIF